MNSGFKRFEHLGGCQDIGMLSHGRITLNCPLTTTDAEKSTLSFGSHTAVSVSLYAPRASPGGARRRLGADPRVSSLSDFVVANELRPRPVSETPPFPRSRYRA